MDPVPVVPEPPVTARERALLVVDALGAVEATVAVFRRFAPTTTRVHVLVLTPAAGLDPRRDADVQGPSHDVMRAIEEQLRATPAVSVPAGELGLELTFEAAFDAAQVSRAAQHLRASLVLVGPWPSYSPRARVLAMLELSSREGVDVVSVGAACDPRRPRSDHLVLSLESGSRSLPWTATALRTLPMGARITVVLRGARSSARAALEAELALSLPGRSIEIVASTASLAATGVELVHEAEARGAESIVLASDDLASVAGFVSGLFAAETVERASVPILLVRRHPDPSLVPERLLASDALRRADGSARTMIERVSMLGRAPFGPTEQFVLIERDARPPLPHDAGVVVIPPDRIVASRESIELVLTTSVIPLTPVRFRIVPDGRLVFVDAALDAADLARLDRLGTDLTPVFVRLRADETFEAVRARIARVLPDPLLLDASTVLDDSGARDVLPELDSLRLVRVALHARAEGATVVAGVVRDDTLASGTRLPVFGPSTLAGEGALAVADPVVVDDSPEERRWRTLTDAPCVQGHAVALTIDNADARRALLRSFATAHARIHLQSYIVEDDPITTEIVAGLVAAASRGVVVRVLVDSLYSRHESFGATNPQLVTLAKAPGVEVLGYEPLSGMPSIEDLKQRNHRKVVVVDGAVATLGGRNLGAPYYRGLDEVVITGDSGYRDVPWLDTSLTLEGPLVAEFERAFRADWRRSGGGSFTIAPVPPAGPVDCRLVLHDGLSDTHTLDALLELVTSARRRLVVVNTFPLVLELQNALVEALRRGVHVDLCFGSVRPRFAAGVAFRGGSWLTIADELVRSRLDPVLRAGAAGWEYAVEPREGWSPGLGLVFPHVHAKLFVRDEDAVAIGSANVDVTSAYWESEAMLVVHDEPFARRTLGELAATFAAAKKVEADGERWTKDEARRYWIGKHWSPLLG